MNSTITKELLFDHFNGTVSARQRRLIDEWAQKLENEELFYKYLLEWELSRPQYEVNVEKGIAVFRQKDAQTDIKDVITSFKKHDVKIRWIWLAAACTIALLFATGWLFQKELIYETLSTGPGEIRTWTLEDGSRVSLNANSELVLPRWNFAESTQREVILKGEAEFVVTHTRNNARFIVKTPEGVNVTVLGTQFTVYSRPGKTEILLNKGKVQVHHSARSNRVALIMAPGDVITLDNQGKVAHNRFSEPAQYAAWKESRFVFEQTTMTEIARLLENNYSLTVKISSAELAAQTISGSFKAQDEHELITSICRILDIQYHMEGKHVTFFEDRSSPQ
ncbi:MAG: hypothetical protein BGO21_32045 [Dyadobacter sp. 50-39]|nr:MAG: hypothetical protein BGO21_32045 [Dyadobacter sp. 50-39]